MKKQIINIRNKAALLFVIIPLLFPACSGSSSSGGDSGSAGTTVSQVIGASGGTVTHPGGASVVIPAGALTGDKTITVTSYTDSRSVNRKYGITPFRGGAEFGPSGTVFQKPVTITLPVGTPLQAYEEHSLYVYNEGNSFWDDTAVKASANSNGTKVSAQVTHFTGYATPDIPPAILEYFRSFWTGGDPSVALGSYIAWFLTATDFMGYTVRTDDAVYEVVGINFSVNTREDGTSGSAAGMYGTAAAGMTTSLNYTYDYTGPGGTELNFNLLVTLHWQVTEDERSEVSVDIIEPVPGSNVSGITQIGIFTRSAARVEFYVDSVKVREDTDAPFGWLWDTTQLADGSHTVKAIAYDSGTGSAESEEITVTVNNTSQGPKAVYFTDEDMNEGQIGGTVTIRKADDESSITHYVVYYGASSRIRLGGQSAIAELAKTGSDLSCAISGDTSIPSGATHILVFAKTLSGDVDNPAAVLIEDSKAGPEVGSWGNTTGFITARHHHSSVIHNGYIYIIGGCFESPFPNMLSDVQYAKINPDGTLGAWQSTGAFAGGRFYHSSEVNNGYIYIIGGAAFDGTNSSYTGNVQYSIINSDGTLGTWQNTTVLPSGSGYGSHASAVYNGYIYIAGGITGPGTDETSYKSAVYHVKINSDGTLGTWQSTTFFDTKREGLTSVVFDGNIYITGGRYWDDSSSSFQYLNDVQYAPFVVP